MYSPKLTLLLPMLLLTFLASGWSYQIEAGEQLWKYGQPIEEGIRNLHLNIFSALRRNGESRA